MSDTTHDLNIVREALKAEGLTVHVKLIDAAIEDVANIRVRVDSLDDENSDLRAQLASAKDTLKFALECFEIDLRRKGLDCTNATPESVIGRIRAHLSETDEKGTSK